jgi:putative two-component system response regulator
MRDGAHPTSEGKLLVVDDDEQIRRLLRHLLSPMGYEIQEAASAEEAFDRLSESSPDLVLLDVHLPGKSGLDVLATIRGEPSMRLLPVVMLTGGATREERLRAIEAGVTDFIAKPFALEELAPRVRSLVQLKFFTDALEDAELVIVALAKTIDARDPYTASHSERVSFYAGLLGERIGLRGAELAAVRRGGLFHDLGKIAISDAVLYKPGKLAKDEFDEIKRHPVEGRNLIQHMKTLSYAMEVVYHHHERFDGSGYPAGLAGEAIPITARVTTIADIYDALTTARVYRAALTREEALRIMSEEAKKGWWDPHLLDEFLGVLSSMSESDRRSVRPPSSTNLRAIRVP